ncbi:MAG: HlyD family type I secretion periplasmic adaptor subunit [Pseudomonadota bacterium]
MSALDPTAHARPTPDAPTPTAAATPATAASTGAPTAISADLLRPLPSIWNTLLLSLVACVFALIAWAALATVQETTKGTGRIIPASKIQVVQNLEGGIIGKIQVVEGQTVQKGAVLLHIDPTQANASHSEATQRIAGLRALIVRLEAEAHKKPIAFDSAFAVDHRRYVFQQRTLYDARKAEFEAAKHALASQARQREQELRELDAKVATLKVSLSLAQQELSIIAPLARTRAASKTELIAIESKVNQVRGDLRASELAIPRVTAQLDEVRNRRDEHEAKFRADALRELSKARVELDALVEANRGAADTLERTVVRAPVTGIVKTVHVTTQGQVVKPGSDLVDIVPQDDTLLVEARVRPQDIAFLRPGQPALVKLTAYDFSLFGGIDGELERIGADSITDDKGETYYLIRVRTAKGHIGEAHERLPILPGMVAEVDIITGARTVLTYLTKPLTRMRQVALTER